MAPEALPRTVARPFRNAPVAGHQTLTPQFPLTTCRLEWDLGCLVARPQGYPPLRRTKADSLHFLLGTTHIWRYIFRYGSWTRTPPQSWTPNFVSFRSPFFFYERFPFFFLSALVSILTIIRWTHNVNANGTSIIALLFWAQFMFGNIMTISHFHLFFQTERGPALEIW